MKERNGRRKLATATEKEAEGGRRKR